MRENQRNHTKKYIIGQAICLAAAVLCFLYGAAINAVGSGTGFFRVWIGLGLFFLVFGIAVHVQLFQKLPKPLSWLIRGIILLGLLVLIVTEAAVCTHFTDTGDQGLDYIVVLGAQVRENGPSVVLQYRLDEALEYLNDNPDTICIVTGAQGYNEPCTEAECMADYLVKNGIPENRIIRENEALNTVQNIRNSSEFFDPETDTVGIVTNDFHMYRALHIAEKQGVQHVSGIASGSPKFYLPNNCLREFFGVIKDLIKGNMKL